MISAPQQERGERRRLQHYKARLQRQVAWLQEQAARLRHARVDDSDEGLARSAQMANAMLASVAKLKGRVSPPLGSQKVSDGNKPTVDLPRPRGSTDRKHFKDPRHRLNNRDELR